MNRRNRFATVVTLLALLIFVLPPAAAVAADTPPVTAEEDADSFTLSNGIVTARILKSNGDVRFIV